MREERHAITSVLLCKTSVAGFALSKIVQTLKKLQAVFWVPVRFSAWLMPDAQKEKPSAHSSCAKGECLAVPPFLMLLSRISQRSFNGDRTGRLTVKVQPVGSKATFHTCFPTDSSQPVGNLSLAVLWYVLLFLTTFFFFAIVCIIAEDFSFVKGEFRSLLLRNFLRLFH